MGKELKYGDKMRKLAFFKKGVGEYEKIEDGRIQPLCYGCGNKTNTHNQQWVDYPEGGGFYTFCCDNTDCVRLQWNSVVEDGNNLYRVQKPVEALPAFNPDDQDLIIIKGRSLLVNDGFHFVYATHKKSYAPLLAFRNWLLGLKD